MSVTAFQCPTCGHPAIISTRPLNLRFEITSLIKKCHLGYKNTKRIYKKKAINTLNCLLPNCNTPFGFPVFFLDNIYGHFNHNICTSLPLYIRQS